MRPKGSKLSEEHKAKIAKALTGNKNERRKRLGYLNSPETRQKMSKAKEGYVPWNKGKKFSEESRKKMSIAQLKRYENPENHPRWLNGKSFEPYTREFTNQLKYKIRRRDFFSCQLCQVLEKDYFQKLSVNHIDYDKTNCSEDNLITLCRSCNSKVNAKREYWCQYFKLKVQRL